MAEDKHTITILVAEDDADDRLMAQDAFEESHLANKLEFVEDGEELLEYLRSEGRYAPPNNRDRPGILLLDLNMPRMDGREALTLIKADPLLRQIPVVVLTTSQAEEDIVRTYDLGVSGFISKPVTFEGLVQVMKTIGQYYFQILSLP